MAASEKVKTFTDGDFDASVKEGVSRRFLGSVVRAVPTVGPDSRPAGGGLQRSIDRGEGEHRRESVDAQSLFCSRDSDAAAIQKR